MFWTICLKCYNHPNVEAVGVCSVCSQGVCEACAVKVSGKLYCKADVERTFAREKPRQVVKSVHVAVSSMFYLVLGCVSVLVGIALLWASSASLAVPALPGLTEILAITNLNATGGGLAFLIVGILMAISGYGMWALDKVSGVLAIGLGLLGIALGMALSVSPAVGAGALVVFFAFLFAIYNVSLAWNELR